MVWLIEVLCILFEQFMCFHMSNCQWLKLVRVSHSSFNYGMISPEPFPSIVRDTPVLFPPHMCCIWGSNVILIWNESSAYILAWTLFLCHCITIGRCKIPLSYMSIVSAFPRNPGAFRGSFQLRRFRHERNETSGVYSHIFTSRQCVIRCPFTLRACEWQLKMFGHLSITYHAFKAIRVVYKMKPVKFAVIIQNISTFDGHNYVIGHAITMSKWCSRLIFRNDIGPVSTTFGRPPICVR